MTMKTAASNRKIRTLITGIRNKTLILNPKFHRRLIWTDKDQKNFLETVLAGYPFPEIYVADGEADPETEEETEEEIEWLVDGQQRISTLYRYFYGYDSFITEGGFRRYTDLSKEEQVNFLEYEVAVRDLGDMSIKEIKKLFEKINATSYGLNAMEIHRFRFDGEFKKFAEEIAQHSFFERHYVFTANEIRHMLDIKFALVFIITIMLTYFNYDSELEDYLSTYNDEFEVKDQLRADLNKVFKFIDDCNFDIQSRVWHKADLLTLLVETYRLMIRKNRELVPQEAGEHLKRFYRRVDDLNGPASTILPPDQLNLLDAYAKAASQDIDDRTNRITRSDIIHHILEQDKEYQYWQ